MDGKVIVITGASSGIGAAAATSVARRGGSVVLVARREAELGAVAEGIGGNALPVVADVTNRADVRRVVGAALERFGYVDVWVNNVGRGITRMPSQLTDDERQVRDAAREYCQGRLLPRVLEAFRHEKTDVSIFREMGALGLLGPTIPETYGGAGLNYR